MKKPKLLRSYQCSIEDYFSLDDYSIFKTRDLISTHIGTSHSQARYKFWREHSECLNDYNKCFKYIKVKSLGAVKPEHYFGNQESFESMKKYRGLDFLQMGMIVDVEGKLGWVIGSNSSCNLDVMFEGEEYPYSNCHPHWETTYYDDKMNVIKDFKRKYTEVIE